MLYGGFEVYRGVFLWLYLPTLNLARKRKTLMRHRSRSIFRHMCPVCVLFVWSWQSGWENAAFVCLGENALETRFCSSRVFSSFLSHSHDEWCTSRHVYLCYTCCDKRRVESCAAYWGLGRVREQ